MKLMKKPGKSRCQAVIIAPMVTIEPITTLEDIAEMQQKAAATEQAMWQQRGGANDITGV